MTKGGGKKIYMFKDYNPENIYLLKDNKRNTTKICEMCSQLTTKTSE